MDTEITAVPATTWINNIQYCLPDNPRSRNVVARVLLLLLRIRNAPGFGSAAANAFTMLPTIAWPDQFAEATLSSYACAFPFLDDAIIESIQGCLQKLLDENSPKDPLRPHLATTFGVTCADRDHLARVDDNPAAMVSMFMITLQTSVDVDEDFVMNTATPLSNEEISAAVRTFYETRGYVVRSADNLFAVQKGDEQLGVKYSNLSATYHYVLVTVES